MCSITPYSVLLIRVFSYDAAEDNELSFKEGDRITEIDKVDADWWQGKANGATGLFPGESMTSQPTVWTYWISTDCSAAYVVAPADYQS